MNLIGLLRTLQPEIMTFIGFIILISIVFFWMLHYKEVISNELESTPGQVKKIVLIFYALSFLIASVIFGWRFVQVISYDRMPRADVDTSTVYQDIQNRKKKALNSEH